MNVSATTYIPLLCYPNRQQSSVLASKKIDLLFTLFRLSFISSNPWNCDCELHGLPDILRSVTYTGIPTCATPANLSGAAMSSLTEDHLVCGELPGTLNNVSSSKCVCHWSVSVAC